MGCCGSGLSEEEQAARAANAKIEKQLEQERKSGVKEAKVLLLGAGESGKSTIFRQVKLIHQDGFSPEELASKRDAVYFNIHQAIYNICAAIPNMGLSYETEAAQEAARAVLTIDAYEKQDSETYRQQVFPALRILLQDAAVQAAIERAREFYLPDSAPYYFEDLERIAAPDYTPTVEDVLRVRIKTAGILETRFTIGQLRIHLFDVGGQRSERKKWIHCFENVTSVLYCVALSGYNQMLIEDTSQNRMTEALLLFETVVNSKWFTKSSVILFLNMTDLFRKKLLKDPLSNYFPDYTGGTDFNKATEFILERFSELNRANLPLYPHLTCATDTKNIKFVLDAVRDTLLQNSLKSSGLM